MTIQSYCDYCGSQILEERDIWGNEVKIIYTCKCMEDNEVSDEDTDYLLEQWNSKYN